MNEPFKGFWNRLHSFVENVQVSDAMSEEEKSMILSVCNDQSNANNLKSVSCQSCKFVESKYDKYCDNCINYAKYESRNY